MKVFRNLAINGDTLQVNCTDIETHEESAFEIGVTFCFSEHEQNDFIGELRPLYSNAEEKVPSGAYINGEYTENISSDVPKAVFAALEERGILVDAVGYEDEEDERNRKLRYIEGDLKAAMKQVLDPDTIEDDLRDEDAELLQLYGIDPCDDVPDEVLELIKMGVPVLNMVPQDDSADGEQTENESAEDWRWDRFSTSYQALTSVFQKPITDEIRLRSRKHNTGIWRNLALIIRKDSLSNTLAEGRFALDEDYIYFYALPKEEAEKLSSFLMSRSSEVDYWERVTLDLFVEEEDGCFAYAEAFLDVGMFQSQERIKSFLSSRYQDDSIVVLPLQFNTKICPVCRKHTWAYDSYGGGVCPICGCCEFRLEDNMSIADRRKWFKEKRSINPHFMAQIFLKL